MALDDLGMENVRIRLVQRGTGPTDVFLFSLSPCRKTANPPMTCRNLHEHQHHRRFR
jgi:hypothetical protein